MNRRGQALIEFIIILPILLIIILGIIDFGFILAKSNRLESQVDGIIQMYQNDESFEAINQFVKKDNDKVKVELKNEDNKFINIILTEEYKPVTPGLNLIIGSPYFITSKRVIYYE